MISFKPKNQNFKIALYIRVSTEEQAENPEGSIRNQEDRLRQAVEYKNRNGNFGEIKAMFVDPGISAKDMKRPKLQELLRSIRAGEIDLVMVTELSRLSRNIRDFTEMWDMMREHGCGFTSLREDFDTTTAAGEMVIFQLMNLAQFERRQTSERVEANIAVRAARGLYNGGCVPLGYKTIKDKPGYLEVDEPMAVTVQAGFTAFLTEGSLARAAIWLNDNGHKPQRHREGGGRFSRVGHFTVDNLQAILRNKAYIEIKVFTHRGESKEAKAVWTPLIDQVTFERVGKILEKNRSRYKPSKDGKRSYFLSGITHCQKCQSFMPGKSATGRTTKIPYYEHAWATKRDSTLTKKLFKCDPQRVPAKKLEPFVMEKFKDFLTRPEFMKSMLEKVKSLNEENPLRKDQERLKAKIYGITSQIDGLAERLAVLPKSVSAAPIYKQMERLEDIKKSHEEELEELKQSGRSSLDRVVDLEKFEDFASHYKKFVTMDMLQNDLKLMIKKFIHKVEVGVDSVNLHWIVDGEHYDRELALARAGSRSPAAPSGATLDFKRYVGSQSLTFGAVNVQVVELPNAIKMVPMQWKKLKINLEDLAKLRWIDGLTIPQICNAIERSRSTVQVSIRTLRNGGFSLLNLSNLEKNIIKKAIIKEIIKYGLQGRKD